MLKYPLFLSYFNATLIFLAYFLKKTEALNFMKIPTVGVELFHADRRMDGYDKVNSYYFAISCRRLKSSLVNK